MDESRLLTDEEITSIFKAHYWLLFSPELYRYQTVLKEQDAKTAAIKDRECQERVERIFKELELYTFAEPQHIAESGKDLVVLCLTAEDLLDFKQREGVK